MADESDLEKTEQASSRRLKQARDEGQVPHSRELSAFLVMMAAAVTLWGMGPSMTRQAGVILRQGLSFGHAEATEASRALQGAADLGEAALWAMLPLLGVSVLAALAAPFVMGGFVFSPKLIAPDFGRLSPASGLKRIVSMQGVGEMFKAILKAAVVAIGAWWVVMREQGGMLDLLAAPLDQAMGASGSIVLWSLVSIIAGMALVVAVDVPFQLWQYHSRLKMSKEELRREAKEDEGDPQVKARIRSMQREMARRRMMQEVPKADVVVTNPTHFAVALKYEPDRMRAPRVLAKGADEVARRIRELATEHGVPLLEAPALARALHRHTELGDEIPVSLYTAVAEVLAYVHQLNQFRAQGGKAPTAPDHIDVPADLDPATATKH